MNTTFVWTPTVQLRLPEALQEAEQRGIRPATTTGVWRARAVTFVTSVYRKIGGEFGSIVTV